MPLPAVLVLCEVLGVPSLEGAEVFIDLEALVVVFGNLQALGHLVGSLCSVVVEALDEGAFVRETGELVVSLHKTESTLYSSNSKGTSLMRLRWFSGRSLSCM